MITYKLTTSATGFTDSVIPYGPEIKNELDPTIQVGTTNSASGQLQMTLDGSLWTNIFDVSVTSATPQTMVFDGTYGNFRLNLSANNGDTSLIVGV